ncbi:sigma-54-dependent Fis family transcriptional regulator [Priestia aryabhattai]|nr:sigma-54-dependent Fis family transcriptional regulator [Priestia aryabhattai]
MSSIKINDSFILTSPSTSMSQIKSELSNFEYVIVFDKHYYIFHTTEQFALQSASMSMPIIDWIYKTNWSPSTISTWLDLKTSKVNWERPVLIQAYETNSIHGVLHPSDWIHYLQAENEDVFSYFETLGETINDAVTVVDDKGKVVLWNTAAENTYKIAKQAIVGEFINTYFDDESIVLHKILNEGRPIRGAYHKPNKETHVLVNASPIVKGHKVIGAVATEHDITNIIRLHEEVEQDPLVGDKSLFSSIIGENSSLEEEIEMAKKVSSTNIPILLTGEVGSGKELLAQAIHYDSTRRNEPFITLNCATIPPGLIDMELFGYQQGVFSQPTTDKRPGKLELAANGTLFIQDVHKMPLDVQIKLCDYLENAAYYMTGSNEQVQVNTRIMASTSILLESLIEQGEFYEGLYYQLTVINIHIPPLKERQNEIPTLITQFIEEFSIKYEKAKPILDEDIVETLCHQEWPGNVRELRNTIERLILLNDLPTITAQHLPAELKRQINLHEPSNEASSEKQLIQDTLKRTYGNKSAAADLLGISRGTLYNKIKEYGL